MRIDVEDASGQRVGPGPITTATRWVWEPALDGAGTFQFEMPATDERQLLAQPFRRVRAYVVERGVRREIGAGIVLRRELTVGPDGERLRVSGDDLLRELAWQGVGDLAVYDQVMIHPASVRVLTVAPAGEVSDPAWTDLAVGDSSTAAEIAALEAWNQFIYVSADRPFGAVDVVLGAQRNATATALRIQYFNGQMGGWDYVQVTEDTTAVGGAPLAQSGRIAWNMPPDWAPEASTDACVYEVRITAEANLSDVDVADVAVEYNQATLDGLALIMARAPAGWSLDTVNGYDATRPPAGAAVWEEGFEDFTGAADDGVSDVFAGWTAGGTDDAHGDHVEASATRRTGAAALKLTTSGSVAGDGPYLGRAFAVTPGVEHQIVFWTRADVGSGGAAFRLYDEEGGTPLTSRQATGIEGTTWQRYSFRFTTPANRSTVYVRLYAPYYLTPGSAWVDDFSLEAIGTGGAYFSLAGESVLEALDRLREQTGEHYILSPAGGRQVCWLRDDVRDAGVRLIGGMGAPVRLLGNADVALIEALDEVQDAYELATRVYACGGGTGVARVSLAEATREPPAGYVLDVGEGYLERTAAATALGRIDRYMDYPEVNAATCDLAQRQAAANALFDRAYHWLRRHSATDMHPITGDAPRAYQATVVKLERGLWPGYWVRAVYRRVRPSRVIEVDAYLCVLGCTVTVDTAGVRTTALRLGTVDAPVSSDLDVLVQSLRQVRSYFRQTQAGQRGQDSGTGAVVSQTVWHGQVMSVVRRMGVSARHVLAGPVSNADTAPTFRELVEADIPAGIMRKTDATIDGGYFTDTYSGSPFDIDGGAF